MRSDLHPQRLLAAYAVGVFPMADDSGELHWLAPDPRCVIELDTFKPSRSLRAICRRGEFEIAVDRAFADVLDACANRPEGTWISPEIREAYIELHRLGFAHSVESWREGELAGGLYGVSLGGAFFGESMFHRVTDASKVALVALIERMRERGLDLLDVQFLTDHLRQLGAIEIPRSVYEERLGVAVTRSCSFTEPPTADTTVSGENDRENQSTQGGLADE